MPGENLDNKRRKSTESKLALKYLNAKKEAKEKAF
jgi:hypothetical protein